MKLLSLGTAAAFLLVTLGSAPAQTLLKNAVLTGKLYSQLRSAPAITSAQPEGQMSTKVVTTPLTIGSLLAYFGYPEVKPNTVGLFLDGNNITVAKKDGSIAYGTLASLAETGRNALVDATQSYFAAEVALLSDTLTGEGLISSKAVGKNKVTVQYSFTGHGTAGDHNFVIKGAVSYAQLDLR